MSQLTERIITLVECSGLKIPPDSWDVKTSESYPEPLQTKMSTKLREGAALTPVVHIREEHEGLRIVKVEEEEDHAWEQKPGQQGNEYNYQELLRRRFRQFRYQEAPGPQEALSQLRELCQKWLQPELHSKEQILELLVLEQFLTILPKELQARVWGYHPRSGEEVVTVLENLETELGDKGQQVPGSAHYKQVLWKEVGPGSLAGQSLTVQLKCDPWEHIPLQENGFPWIHLALSQLRDLCHQCLRPEMHTKEQILELLVLEQFHPAPGAPVPGFSLCSGMENPFADNDPSDTR
ncbi:SCAN domain-containing protein 3 [Camelus dromedarius]|uniref:SCAN domain-containing protein 3 n=1 Tax=Camelus dromedarius TaxID=9838 RepID=A0A5N4CSN5_CAMDR|nr:SCAN domain-containing protein 3 [Camelus dromedarius]